MGPKAKSQADENIREVALANVPNRGLGYYQNNKLVLVTDVNLQLLGT